MDVLTLELNRKRGVGAAEVGDGRREGAVQVREQHELSLRGTE